MADKTQLNRNLNNGNATVLNRGIAPNQGQSGGSSTVLNPRVSATGAIIEGTVLCDKYRVVEKMPVSTGEADLYICSRGSKKYVAKVYRRTASIKAEVAEQLRKLKSQYVATVYEIGEYRGATVEILPYYSRGSLNGKIFTYEQLRSGIIPCLNEGLKVLHDANIIHKDLKPSNIMVSDDQQSVAIIDFGISSVTEAGNTVIVTQTGMTPAYSAPETFKGLYSSHADYYALGITLYELFCGKTPYGDLPTEDLEKYLAIQRIPFPKNMPTELQELIKALTYFDISNRRDKNNPNRRWGYDEVKKWLAGVKQTIPGEGVDRRSTRPYFFAGKNYTARTDLVRALVEHWDEGKKELFRGKLSDYYKILDSEVYQTCLSAEREATRISGKDDFIFWKTMYALQPQTKDFFWKGRVYIGLPALGRDLLEHLRKNSPAMNDYMDGVLKEELLSKYITMKDPSNEKVLAAVQGLESSYRAYINNPREKRITLYLVAYMLSNQKVFYVAGQEFHTLGELTSYMKEILGPNNEHLDQFKEFCHRLMDQYDNLIPAFESWLIAIGKREALDSWKEAMKS